MWLLVAAVLVAVGALHFVGGPTSLTILVLLGLGLPLLWQLRAVFLESTAPAPAPADDDSELRRAPQVRLAETEPVHPFTEWWPAPAIGVGGRAGAETARQGANSIAGIVVDSPYRFINLRIDDAWLNESLGGLHPGRQFEGLIPALNFIYMHVPMEAHGFPAWAEAQEKVRFIARRILPPEGDTCISPLLVCPGCDFLGCTVVVAEITNAGSVVRWDRLGVDRTRSWIEDGTSFQACQPSGTRVLGDIFEGSRNQPVRLFWLTGSWKEVGTSVDWLPGIAALTFEMNEYLRMLASFREHYERERAPGLGDEKRH